ncbi:hypothetical protein F66182_18348, partial [Fusarium sp. NRRL 66182]
MPAVDVSSVPAVSGKETANSVAVVESLIQNLSISKTPDEANTHANNLATLLNGPIEEKTVPLKAVEALKKQLTNKKDANARERAVEAIRAIAEHSSV